MVLGTRLAAFIWPLNPGPVSFHFKSPQNRLSFFGMRRFRWQQVEANVVQLPTDMPRELKILWSSSLALPIRTLRDN
jgi:hypothetical protein